MALITCPECTGDISDSVKACRKCGYVITPNDFLKGRTLHREWLLFKLMLFSVLGLVIGSCVLRVGQQSTSDLGTQHQWPTLPQKLAVIENASLRGAYDSALTYDLQQRLRGLARKFPESEGQIADMTVKAKELLAEKGVSQSLSQIMDGIDYMIPSGELGVTYAESAALYVVAVSQ